VWHMLGSPGLMQMILEYPVERMVLGTGLLALFVLSAIMILMTVASGMHSRHIAHGH
jgi:hypothetical protein